MKSSNRNYCKGQIIILFAISLVVLVGIVGLAIDSGRAYGVKAKLSGAVDSAVLAAGRALGTGTSDSERKANAIAAGKKFFNGNFPANYLGVTSATINIPDPVHDPAGYWTVTASATANMPTTFIRVLNQNQVTVAAAGETRRRDLDMILVLDVSGSLNIPAGTFAQVQASAVKFIGKFIETTDRIGLVAFSSGAQLKVAIDKTASRGFNVTTVTNAINGLTNGGGTASAEGMRIALNEINAVPALWRSSLRVIVFFSDGAPNTVPATFQYNTTKTPIPTVTGDLYSENTDTGSGVGCGDGIPCGIITNACTNGISTTTGLCDNKGVWTTYLNSNKPSNPISTSLPTNSDFYGKGIITLTSAVSGDAGNPTAVSIPLVRNPVQAGQPGQRSLTGSPYANSRCNVNKAARNMVELVANSARIQTQPIAIYTLGLGNALDSLEIIFCNYDSNEKGANILKRLANTTDSDTHQPDPQPTGIYCKADINTNPSALDGCFDAIASEILRLAK